MKIGRRNFNSSHHIDLRRRNLSPGGNQALATSLRLDFTQINVFQEFGAGHSATCFSLKSRVFPGCHT